MKVLLTKPRGFCAGVDRAIDVVKMALEIYGRPVYMRHQIVHNRYVVSQLEKQGAIFVERTDEIPDGSVAIFSAHGVSPKVREEAKARNLRVIDATCPLVTKVHLEAIRYAREGYAIIVVGHRGHVEMDGTLGSANGTAAGSARLIETIEEARTVEVPTPDKVVVLTQTTLSVDDTAAIIAELKHRFPNLLLPPKEDICYATTNRQAAVKIVAQRAQVVLAIGAPESSNTNRLRDVAEAVGARAYLIQRAADIQPDWLDGVETVGITAGASAPEELVQEVIDWLKANATVESVEEVDTKREDITFVLPHEVVAAAKETGKATELLAKHTMKPKAASTAS